MNNNKELYRRDTTIIYENFDYYGDIILDNCSVKSSYYFYNILLDKYVENDKCKFILENNMILFGNDISVLNDKWLVFVNKDIFDKYEIGDKIYESNYSG